MTTGFIRTLSGPGDDEDPETEIISGPCVHFLWRWAQVVRTYAMILRVHYEAWNTPSAMVFAHNSPAHKAWSTPSATVHIKSGSYHRVMLFLAYAPCGLHHFVAHPCGLRPLESGDVPLLIPGLRSGPYPRDLSHNQGLSWARGSAMVENMCVMIDN